jgi:hypothetical protein
MSLAWGEDIDTLYKFRSFVGKHRIRVLGILAASRIYFSRATEFNDPFDVMPIFRHSGNPNDPKYIARLRRRQSDIATKQGRTEQELWTLNEELGETVEQLPSSVERETRGALRERMRILCLSADGLHPLQWAHYADAHKGVCLHFWSVFGSPFGSARRVKYKTRRKPILISPNPTDRAIIDQLAFSKARVWSYEHEYRLVIPDDTPQAGSLRRGYLKFHPSALKGITFGMRMPARSRNALIHFLARNRPELPLWQAYPDPDHYEVRVNELGIAKDAAKKLRAKRRRKATLHK